MPRTASENGLVSSRDNPVFRQLQRVARRREPGLTWLEGRRVIDEAQAAGVPLQVVAFREGEARAIAVKGERTVVLSRSLFNALSETETPQGVIAVALSAWGSLDEAVERSRRARWPLLVLDGIQDPSNVGAILRSGVAAGAAAVAILAGTADPFSAKAVRASAGYVFRLAVARAGWEDLVRLRGFGADASARLVYTEAALDTAGFLAFGSEAHGLSDRSTAAGVEGVSIPMAAGVESLNVAAAAAVVLFEIARRKSR